MRNPNCPYHIVLFHDMTEVRDFLDRLENQGYAFWQLRILGDNDFAVRWR